MRTCWGHTSEHGVWTEVLGELGGCKGRRGFCAAAEILRPVAQIYLFCSDL